MFKRVLHKVKLPYKHIFLGILILTILICGKNSFDAISLAITKYKWQETFFILSRGYYYSFVSSDNLYANMSAGQVSKILSKNLPTIKMCTDSVKEGCWPKKSLFVDNSPTSWDPHSPGFILYNGVSISHIQDTSLGCDSKEVCEIVSIDLNGLSLPNKFGKDEFRVYYYQDKISPYHPFEDKLVGTLAKSFINVR